MEEEVEVGLAEEAEVQRKVRRAAQLLLLQRPRSPGVKGWELKKSLGKDYVRIVDLLKQELDRLDLDVKIVGEEGESSDDYDKARFFVVMRYPPPVAELLNGGWRIDDLSILAATVAYTVSRHGKVSRKDVEQILKDKFPKWRIDLTLDRFIRLGYLIQSGEDVLSIGWRTRAEIDQKALMTVLLSTSTGQQQEEAQAK
ncbi:MAG: hypothetical protein HYU39_03760 [Thaumarchaeota archaeon]|nr:hypothetical protein [Nitrososphaerota archaeon]